MIDNVSTRLFKLTVVATFILAWSSSPVLADVVSFEWATVGNPGNAGEVQADGTFLGSVGYTYRISKHEVTNAQYACFLNAVATDDLYNLYSTSMGSHGRGGITRVGSSGNFSYVVRTDMGNKPVNFVSFFDAMRFINWLHNGQGNGDTESGVYAIGSGLDEVRQAGAIYFIPSQNEWYKAAYHDPRSEAAGGPPGDDNYWLFPSSSDTEPTIATANATGDVSNPGLDVANYSNGAEWNGQSGNVTTVGSATSISPYGTLDQGGNVWEWNEAVHPFVVVDRVVRGGGYNDGALSLEAGGFPGSFDPADGQSNIGFRVASQDLGSLEVTEGEYVSGGLPELGESDNMDLTIRRRNADLQSRTEFELKSTSPTATPTSFEFMLEGSVFARGNVVQTIELFDYVAGAWELVDTTDANRAPMPDKIVTATATGDLSRFVEEGTMSIEARIRYKSDRNRQTFASNTDQAVWTIGQ